MSTNEAPFRHEALFYDGIGEFVDRIAAFIAEGVAAGEPALVVVGAEKIARLREALGGTPEGVQFADMDEVGLNPARIIPAWRDYANDQLARGHRFRGVGEPISTQRTPAQLVECQRHESLLNVALGDVGAFWLVCPYDTASLPDDVLQEARRSHEFVWHHAPGTPSDAYSGIAAFARPFDAPLPSRPPDADSVFVSIETLRDLRQLVTHHAVEAGFGDAQTTDLVFVANEIASNSVVHAGGQGVFNVWREGDTVVCETKDTGRILHVLVGRERPTAGQVGGLGLWLANQLCDLVQIRTFDDGSVVRVHMSRR
jgi:anti-sigma regulatory factor (Ser/Thr protein kinase)